MEVVSREVIIDLWPSYVSGEASVETRKLVESFLTMNPAFAQTLGQWSLNQGYNLAPKIPPDQELQEFASLRNRLQSNVWLKSLAIFWTAIAVVSVSWNQPSYTSVILAAISICFWARFWIDLVRARRSIFHQDK